MGEQMQVVVREIPTLARIVVARQGSRTLILHPGGYDKGDLWPMLTPAEVALLRSVA